MNGTADPVQRRPLGAVDRFVGRLFATRRFLASLPDDTIRERALGPRNSAVFARKAATDRLAFQALCGFAEESMGELSSRAGAYAERLGRTYRARLAAETVREVVHAPAGPAGSAEGSGLRRLHDRADRQGFD